MRPKVQFALAEGQGQDGETTRRQLKAQDDDHDEAHGEHDRADDGRPVWLVAVSARLVAYPSKRAGKEPADEQVLGGKGAFGRAGGDHRFNDFEWFDVVHVRSGCGWWRKGCGLWKRVVGGS